MNHPLRSDLVMCLTLGIASRCLFPYSSLYSYNIGYHPRNAIPSNKHIVTPILHALWFVFLGLWGCFRRVPPVCTRYGTFRIFSFLTFVLHARFFFTRLWFHFYGFFCAPAGLLSFRILSFSAHVYPLWFEYLDLRGCEARIIFVLPWFRCLRIFAFFALLYPFGIFIFGV